MRVDALLPGLWRLRVAAGLVNAYVIGEGGALYLFDAGPPGTGARIVRLLGHERRRRPLTLLVTHAHPDHVGGAGEVVAGLDCPVMASAQEGALLESGRLLRAQLRARPPFRPLWWFGRRVLPGTIAPVPVGHVLAPGEAVPGTGRIVSYATPGHSAGHTSYLWRRHGGVLIAGDAGASLRGRVITMPINEDEGRTRESLGRLARLAPSLACFGHGPPIADPSRALARASSGVRR